MNKGVLVALLFIISFFSCKKEDLEGDNFFYLKTEGAYLPVYVEGNIKSNTFLIILHGGPGGDDHVYKDVCLPFSDGLEDEFAVVYYDQRGSGISQGKYTDDKVTVAQHVADLENLIKLLKYKYGDDIKLFLLGHSWGGTLGTAFLLKESNQDIVSGWIEVDGAHNFSDFKIVAQSLIEISQEQIALENSVDGWTEILEYCLEVDTNNISDEEKSYLNSFGFKAEQYLTYGEFIISDYGVTLSELLNHSYFSSFNPLMAKLNLAMTNSTMFDEVSKIDYTPELYKIKIPTLILWGRYDFVLPLKLGLQAYQSIGAENKEMVIFYKSGHSVMLNETDEFNSEVIDFIKMFD